MFFASPKKVELHNIHKNEVPVFKHMAKSECCGCEACSNRCPQKAISMEQDEEGFLYPILNANQCISCMQCEKVCPVLTVVPKKLLNKTWAGYAIDHEIVKTSSSGGMFSVLADSFLKSNNKAAVAAAVWADDFKSVQHICSNDKKDIERMKRSKYIQSYKINIYRDIESKINNGYKVLLVGCPCEVAGIKSFLRGKDENLYVIDFVCQGPTSPKVMSEFVEYYEIKYHSTITSINMRHAIGEWIPQYIKIDFKNGKVFCKRFYETEIGRAVKLMQRPACYNCHFAGNYRASDLTFGDYHGADPCKNYYNPDGTSILVVNTIKGMQLRKLLTPINTKLMIAKYAEVAKKNPRLIAPWKPHPRREKFAKDFISLNLHTATRHSLSVHRKILYAIPNKYRNKIIPIVKKILSLIKNEAIY